MAPEEIDRLYGPARRALERARVGIGLRLAAPAVIVVAVALWLRGLDPICVSAGCALCSAIGMCGWRGGPHAEVATPALWAGLVPFAAPLLSRGYGHLCVEGACVSYCLLACGIGGFLAGLVFAARARPRGAAWASGAGILALTGALGCTFAGVPGLLGMLAGGVVGAVPAAWWMARASDIG